MKQLATLTILLVLLLCTLPALQVFGQDGMLDPTFGDNGIVTSDLGISGRDMAIDADGRIVVAGNLGGALAVVRLNANGSLDETFGTEGIATIDPGYPHHVASVAIDADGKIVVAGNLGGAFAVVRLNPNGTPDNTFGTEGIVKVDYYFFGSNCCPGASQTYDLAILADGRILVFGDSYWTDWDGYELLEEVVSIVLWLNPDGSVDEAMTDEYDEDNPGISQYVCGEEIWATAIDDDGKIVMVCETDHYLYGGSREYETWVRRLNPDGSFDNSFGEELWYQYTRVLLYKGTQRNSPYGVAIGADGKIVVAGNNLARLYTDGSIDSTFGTDGVVTTDFRAEGVVLEAGGKIIATGGRLARFNLDGTPDETFGTGGFVTPGFTIESEAIDAQGRIVVVGTTESGFKVARYFGTEVPDTTPPECALVENVKYSHIKVRLRDPLSGLAGVTVVKKTNANVVTDAFDPGSTDEVFVTATKILPKKASVLELEVIDMAGNVTRCDPVLTTLAAEVPSTFSLEGNYPNPFNPSTTIRFQIAEPSHVTLTVFDVMGRTVANLVDQEMSAGSYAAEWDGRSDAGAVVAGGIYFYRIEAGSFVETRAMSLVK